jgi:hypothetical protein
MFSKEDTKSIMRILHGPLSRYSPETLINSMKTPSIYLCDGPEKQMYDSLLNMPTLFPVYQETFRVINMTPKAMGKSSLRLIQTAYAAVSGHSQLDNTIARRPILCSYLCEIIVYWAFLIGNVRDCVPTEYNGNLKHPTV